MSQRHLLGLPAFDGNSTEVTAVIEAPRGSAVKFDYNPTINAFQPSYILPAGSHFPFEFGFVPSTRAEDGDPLEVLVFMDAPGCVGCVVTARPIGLIEGEQTRDGETFRSDRLIGVASALKFAHLRSIDDVDARIMDEIEHFFFSYDQMRRRRFKPLRRGGRNAAIELVRRSMCQYARGASRISPLFARA